jgi:putative ABC transport system permease protein
VTGWRTALRIARREARHARGRSALVVAMIALPMAALAFVAAAQATFRLSPGERADRLMGTAQALVIWPEGQPVVQRPGELFWGPANVNQPGGGPFQVSGSGPASAASVERLLALLPPGSRASGEQLSAMTVRTANGTGTLATRTLDLADPLTRGILRPLSGRAPAGAGEVALTPAASRRLGAGPGGTVRSGDGAAVSRVVGILEDPTDLEAATIVAPVAAYAGPRQEQEITQRWLVATPRPLTWNDVKRLNQHGVVAVSRHVLEHPPGAAERYPGLAAASGASLQLPALVGGLALLEVVLLAGPAFAVGARRRRRELALLAAAGGTPAHLRRVVLADGVVLGLVAAAGGLALGIGAAAAGRPLVEEHLALARSGAFRVDPPAQVALAGVAVATAVLAAMVPAWIASRQDVVAALAGRRGITRSRRRWLVLGLVLAAAGGGVAATGALRVEAALILAGLVVVELGLVLCTPAIVGLAARLGQVLPLSVRIALRQTSRNRTAAAPAISAVMAAVVGSLAVGVLLSASSQRNAEGYRSLTRPGQVVLDHTGKLGDSQEPVPPRAIAALRRLLPVEHVDLLGQLSCGREQCAVLPQVPAGRDCPAAPWVLGRDPNPGEQRAARQDARCDGVGYSYRYFEHLVSDNFTLIVDADPATVAALTGLPAEDASRTADALRAGKVVVDHSRYLHGGSVTLAVREFSITPGKSKKEDQRLVTTPGFALPRPPRAPVLLLTARTARSLGLGSVRSLALATTSRMPTVAEADRLQSELDPIGVYVERGPRASGDTRSLLLLALAAGVIALGAAAIATGLAAADSRADLGTLAAVGASPRVRRGLSLSQSGVIAGLGSLLGAAAGLGGSIAVLIALNRGAAVLWPAPTPYPITVPWPNVGIALLVVPLVAMLGAGLLTRSRLPIERRL